MTDYDFRDIVTKPDIFAADPPMSQLLFAKKSPSNRRRSGDFRARHALPGRIPTFTLR